MKKLNKDNALDFLEGEIHVSEILDHLAEIKRNSRSIRLHELHINYQRKLNAARNQKSSDQDIKKTTDSKDDEAEDTASKKTEKSHLDQDVSSTMIEVPTPMDDANPAVPDISIAKPRRVDIYSMDDMRRVDTELGELGFLSERFDTSSLCKPDAQQRELLAVTHQHAFNCRALTEKFPNLRELFEIVSGAATLCYLSGLPIKLPNLLLDGPPGCGKTRAIHHLAEALELPLYTIHMAHLHGQFELAGGHRTYKGSEPGLLSKILLKSHCANPIVLFDEVENGAPNLYGPLYSFLEDPQFTDHYLQLPITTGHINKILLTNNKEKLLPAIRSRVREMQVAPPTRDEMVWIIRRIYSDLREQHAMYQKFVDHLSDDVTNKLIASPLRQVRLCLENAMCKAAFSRWNAAEFFITVDDLPIENVDVMKRPPGFAAWLPSSDSK